MEAIRNGDIPVDLVLLGMIAVFLILRLRSVLGRRVGFEKPEPSATVARGLGLPSMRGRKPAFTQPEERIHVLPDATGLTGQILSRMRAADRSFDAARFLDNAERAFRVIVTAYAKGDRDALRPLLTDATFAVFSQAIEAREQAGESQRTEIQAIRDATIDSARLEDNRASITVRFVSDQVNVTLNRAGEPTEGVDSLAELVDLWAFERDLGSRDPTWRLAGTESA